MLVLSRKKGEELVIAGEIIITVVEVEHGRVRLGVSAASDISVDRREIHERKQRYPEAPPPRGRYAGIP